MDDLFGYAGENKAKNITWGNEKVLQDLVNTWAISADSLYFDLLSFC